VGVGGVGGLPVNVAVGNGMPSTTTTRTTTPRPDDEDLFELLDPIDWTLVGSEAMTVDSIYASPTPPLSHPNLRPQTLSSPSTSPAKHFITHSGTVTFNGALHRGGYNSARRILLDYANLMKSTAKWNVRGYCRILRVMSDSLIEMEEEEGEEGG